MTSLQVVLSDNKTDFITDFNPPINFNHPCEIALINLETYYSIPNITRETGRFWIRDITKPNARYNIRINTGSYSLTDIIKIIEEKQKIFDLTNVNNQYAVKFSGDINTFKTKMIIQPGYIVDFTENELNQILGFEAKEYKEGTYESERDVNILPVNSILVNLNIIEGSYVKGQKGNTIYSFFPNVNPGHKIIERPPYPLYSPLLLSTLNSVRMTLTDQNGELIDLRGENLTARFHIRNIN